MVATLGNGMTFPEDLGLRELHFTVATGGSSSGGTQAQDLTRVQIVDSFFGLLTVG